VIVELTRKHVTRTVFFKQLSFTEFLINLVDRRNEQVPVCTYMTRRSVVSDVLRLICSWSVFMLRSIELWHVETVVSGEHTTSIFRVDVSYMEFRNRTDAQGRWQNGYPLY